MPRRRRVRGRAESERAVPAPETPLLHRLLGDTHPVHVDPSFAHTAGFEGPLMHGLCTYGYACRALLRHGGGELRAMRGRFVRPLLPGRPIVPQIRQLGPGELGYRVIDEGSGEPVIADGHASLAP